MPAKPNVSEPSFPVIETLKSLPKMANFSNCALLYISNQTKIERYSPGQKIRVSDTLEELDQLIVASGQVIVNLQNLLSLSQEVVFE